MAPGLPLLAAALSSVPFATASSAPPVIDVPLVVRELVGEYTRQPMRVPSNQTVGAPILVSAIISQCRVPTTPTALLRFHHYDMCTRCQMA